MCCRWLGGVRRGTKTAEGGRGDRGARPPPASLTARGCAADRLGGIGGGSRAFFGPQIPRRSSRSGPSVAAPAPANRLEPRAGARGSRPGRRGTFKGPPLCASPGAAVRLQGGGGGGPGGGRAGAALFSGRGWRPRHSRRRSARPSCPSQLCSGRPGAQVAVGQARASEKLALLGQPAIRPLRTVRPRGHGELLKLLRVMPVAGATARRTAASPAGPRVPRSNASAALGA